MWVEEYLEVNTINYNLIKNWRDFNRLIRA